LGTVYNIGFTTCFFNYPLFMTSSLLWYRWFSLFDVLYIYISIYLVGCFKHFFHNIWENSSHWLIFFKMVKTTNQIYTLDLWWFAYAAIFQFPAWNNHKVIRYTNFQLLSTNGRPNIDSWWKLCPQTQGIQAHMGICRYCNVWHKSDTDGGNLSSAWSFGF
jgi:hypothetical protein